MDRSDSSPAGPCRSLRSAGPAEGNACSGCGASESDPDATTASTIDMLKNPADEEHWRDGRRQAGLPEKASAPGTRPTTAFLLQRSLTSGSDP